MNDRVELDRCTLFAGLSDDDCASILSVARVRAISSGEPVFRAGTEPEGLIVVLKGRVELTAPLLVIGEHRDIRLHAFGPGDTLGWNGLFSPHPSALGARAATDARLLVLDRDRLLGLFAANPGLALTLTANVARALGEWLVKMQTLWVRQIQREVSDTYG